MPARSPGSDCAWPPIRLRARAMAVRGRDDMIERFDRERGLDALIDELDRLAGP